MNSIMQIMREYDDIREINRRELEERRQLVYERIPRVKSLDEELVKISIDIARAVLNSSSLSKELISKLEQKQQNLKDEKLKLLLKNNFKADFLDIKYRCKNCKDTGYINTKKCHCLTQRLIQYAYKQSNISSILENENFDEFRFDLFSDNKNSNGLSPKKNIQIIFNDCINYVNDFDKIQKNLLFMGKTGLGKTFMCHCIAKDLLDRGKTVVYQSCSDLIDNVRKYKFDFDNEEKSSSYLKELMDCELLIIDDLGTELSTQFSNQVIYTILNKRLQSRNKMIISTNLDIDEISKLYSDRISSRLFGSFDTYEFIGEDIRLKLKNLI